MKRFILSLFALCAVISCQVEDPNFTNNELESLNKKSNEALITPNQNRNQNLINFLRYYAFFTGEAIKNNPQALQEFLHLVGNNDTVDIYELLKPNTSARTFRSAFLDMYEFYYYNDGKPDDPFIRLPGIDLEDEIEGDAGIINNGAIMNDNSIVRSNLENWEISFNASFNFLTSRNCTELFIPNTLNTNNDFHLLTSGHPLNLNAFNNNAIKIVRLHSQVTNGDSTAKISDISYTNNQNGENIIIARPKVSTACINNSNIPDIDYTLFVRVPFQLTGN